MGHLGSRISAFVDGELPASARDHALAHCERCASCRRDVAVERWQAFTGEAAILDEDGGTFQAVAAKRRGRP